MTLLTAMLDFGDTGEIGLLVTPEGVAAREAAIGRGGLLKGSELAQVFAALRSNDLIWPYVVNGYLKGQAAARVRPAVLEQRRHEPARPDVLLVPAQHLPREQVARARCHPRSWARRWIWPAIDLPTFVYASKEDHIVPWKTAYESTQMLAGDKVFVLGGQRPHRRGDQPAREEQAQLLGRQPDSDGGLRRRPGSAGSRPPRTSLGSWWPAWYSWLAPHAGTKVNARKTAGQRSSSPRSSPPPAAT